MIDYTLLRKAHRKTLTISVSRNNEIIVKANKTIPDQRIRDFVRSKNDWIQKTVKANAARKKLLRPKMFCDGEIFTILDSDYPLSLNPGNVPRIDLNDNKLMFTLSNKRFEDSAYIRAKIIDWYKNAAYEIIFKRVVFFKQMMGLQVKEIMIRELKSSWANCSRSGILTFSWRLLIGPLRIIDYVVVHELSHLVHPDHSRSFWEHVSGIIPDYKYCRSWLKENEGSFLW